MVLNPNFFKIKKIFLFVFAASLILQIMVMFLVQGHKHPGLYEYEEIASNLLDWVLRTIPLSRHYTRYFVQGYIL
jgi:hypothetical protein